MTREQYDASSRLIAGEKTDFKSGKPYALFRRCLPIEVMAERGPRRCATADEAGRVTNPHDDGKAYHCAATPGPARTLTTWSVTDQAEAGAQQRVFRTIPG